MPELPFDVVDFGDDPSVLVAAIRDLVEKGHTVQFSDTFANGHLRAFVTPAIEAVKGDD